MRYSELRASDLVSWFDLREVARRSVPGGTSVSLRPNAVADGIALDVQLDQAESVRAAELHVDRALFADPVRGAGILDLVKSVVETFARSDELQALATHIFDLIGRLPGHPRTIRRSAAPLGRPSAEIDAALAVVRGDAALATVRSPFDSVSLSDAVVEGRRALLVRIVFASATLS